MKYSDIELAFEFVSSHPQYEASAFVSRTTGETYWVSDDLGDDEELPEDLDENDDYVEIPHKHDLDLGQELVWRFVNREIPGLGSKVREIFGRRGAYRRFKDFLAGLNLLETWYQFENDATERALREWCKDEGLELDDEVERPQRRPPGG